MEEKISFFHYLILGAQKLLVLAKAYMIQEALSSTVFDSVASLSVCFSVLAMTRTHDKQGLAANSQGLVRE